MNAEVAAGRRRRRRDSRHVLEHIGALYSGNGYDASR
jgi:hypothetical protein